MEIPQLVARIQDPNDSGAQRWRSMGLAYLVILEVIPSDAAILGAAMIAAQVDGGKGRPDTWSILD